MYIGIIFMYSLDRILPQICSASAKVNIKHVLKQMQYRFAEMNETLSTVQTKAFPVLHCVPGDVKSGNVAGISRRLPLGVVEIGGHCYHSIGYLYITG